MGCCSSKHFTADELSQLSTSVFFTPHEINTLYQRYLKLGGTKEYPIPMYIALEIPELLNNPFRFRIGKVYGEFSPTHPSVQEVLRKQLHTMSRDELLAHSHDITAYICSFATFLSILSDFSSRAPFYTKARVAFELYDYTEDGLLSPIDIECVIETSIGRGSLQPTQISQIANEVLEEADMDGSKRLTEPQFQRLLKRMPDFMNHFQFTIIGL